MDKKVKMRKAFPAFLGMNLVFICFLWGWANAAEEPVTLKLFRVPDPKDTNPFTQGDLAVIRAFEKKYPYIDLKPFSGISIQGMSMDSGPLLAIAGGSSTDVIYVNFRFRWGK